MLVPGSPVSPSLPFFSSSLFGAALPLTHHPTGATEPSGNLALEENEFPSWLGFFSQISPLLLILKETRPVDTTPRSQGFRNMTCPTLCAAYING